MATPMTTAPATETDVLLRRIVSVLIALLLCWWAYWNMMLASKASTFGGYSSDLGRIDSSGTPTEGPLPTVIITLRPSIAFLFLTVLIVIIGVVIARRRASVERADRTLKSTVAVIVGTTVLAIASSQVAFGLTSPREDMVDGQNIRLPFGYIEVEVERSGESVTVVEDDGPFHAPGDDDF